jgi:hypothetical protein
LTEELTAHLAGVRLCVRKPSNNIHNYQDATVLTNFNVAESTAKAAYRLLHAKPSP